jgi:ribosomal protein S8E
MREMNEMREEEERKKRRKNGRREEQNKRIGEEYSIICIIYNI